MNHKIAVMASGKGSNLDVILQGIKREACVAQVEVVICNKADAGALKIAKDAGVKHVYYINPKDYENRAAYDKACSEKIKAADCELIVLAGYMRILSEGFIHDFPDKIINIHPSLLPSFKGGDAVGDALAFGVKVAGCTVHMVNVEVDSGRILAQACVPVFDGDDWASLHQRIQVKEHIIYIEVINQLLLDEQ